MLGRFSSKENRAGHRSFQLKLKGSGQSKVRGHSGGGFAYF